MTMFSKATDLINQFHDTINHGLLQIGTSVPGRLASEAESGAFSTINKLEDKAMGKPTLYGQEIPPQLLDIVKNYSARDFTPLAKNYVTGIPITQISPSIPLPPSDLKGDDKGGTHTYIPFSAATVEPNLFHPHQKQIMFPPGEINSNPLSYEYAHAMPEPLGYGADTVIRDFDKMKKTDPKMYDSIKAGLSSFSDPTNRDTKDSYAAEIMSLAYSRMGKKVLDTPIGIYYKNIIQPDPTQQTNLFKNPVLNFLMGGAGNVAKDMVAGATAMPMNKQMQELEDNASWFDSQAARATDPTKKKYFQSQAQTNRDGAKQIAGQVTGMFSPDVNKPYIPRALGAASEVAGAAGAISGIGSAVASKFAPQAATDTANMTIGQIQEASQRARGLGLLADYDEAAKSGSDSLMKQIAQQIVNSPQGSPYDMYKTVFQKLGGL